MNCIKCDGEGDMAGKRIRHPIDDGLTDEVMSLGAYTLYMLRYS